MSYHLPDDPPAFPPVSPDDVAFWSRLGADADARHTLVIGNPATPSTATVVVVSLLDLARYLGRHLPSTVAELGAQARRGLTHDELAELDPPRPSRHPRDLRANRRTARQGRPVTHGIRPTHARPWGLGAPPSITRSTGLGVLGETDRPGYLATGHGGIDWNGVSLCAWRRQTRRVAGRSHEVVG
jgi:hypothetical protein